MPYTYNMNMTWFKIQDGALTWNLKLEMKLKT